MIQKREMKTPASTLSSLVDSAERDRRSSRDRRPRSQGIPRTFEGPQYLNDSDPLWDFVDFSSSLNSPTLTTPESEQLRLSLLLPLFNSAARDISSTIPDPDSHYTHVRPSQLSIRNVAYDTTQASSNHVCRHSSSIPLMSSMFELPNSRGITIGAASQPFGYASQSVVAPIDSAGRDRSQSLPVRKSHEVPGQSSYSSSAPVSPFRPGYREPSFLTMPQPLDEYIDMFGSSPFTSPVALRPTPPNLDSTLYHPDLHAILGDEHLEQQGTLLFSKWQELRTSMARIRGQYKLAAVRKMGRYSIQVLHLHEERCDRLELDYNVMARIALALVKDHYEDLSHDARVTRAFGVPIGRHNDDGHIRNQRLSNVLDAIEALGARSRAIWEQICMCTEGW